MAIDTSYIGLLKKKAIVITHRVLSIVKRHIAYFQFD